MSRINQAIDKKLLTLEAEKKKVAVDTLLIAEADAKVADPSDGQIQAYYETQNNALNAPLEQIRSDGEFCSFSSRRVLIRRATRIKLDCGSRLRLTS